MQGDAFASVRDRLADFQQNGRPAVLLDDRALGEIAELRACVGWPSGAPKPAEREIRRGLRILVVAGIFLWARAAELPLLEELGVRLEAAELLSAAYNSVPDSVPPELADLIPGLDLGVPDDGPSALQATAVDILDAAARDGDLRLVNHGIWLLAGAARSARGQRCQHSCLSDLGAAWLQRYQLTGRPQELDKAIEAHERGLTAPAREPGHRAGPLANYSTALLARFACRGDVGDLDAAIAAAQRSARLTRHASRKLGPDARHPHRAAGPGGLACGGRLARITSLAALSAALLDSFACRGIRAHLDGAILAARTAASLAGPVLPTTVLPATALPATAVPAAGDADGQLSGCCDLDTLAQALLERYSCYGDLADLIEARAAARAAADAAGADPVVRDQCLATLARAHSAAVLPARFGAVTGCPA